SGRSGRPTCYPCIIKKLRCPKTHAALSKAKFLFSLNQYTTRSEHGERSSHRFLQSRPCCCRKTVKQVGPFAFFLDPNRQSHYLHTADTALLLLPGRNEAQSPRCPSRYQHTANTQHGARCESWLSTKPPTALTKNYAPA